jgi:hypothetical protein
LTKERVQHANRIKGLCAIHGIYDYEPLGPQRMARLEQLRTVQGEQLPARLKAEIRRELQRLEIVLEMISAVETERDAIVRDEALAHLNAQKIQALHKLRAIGPEFATVLVGEVFYRKFDNRRQLGSYLGFTPSPFQSGRTEREPGISKAGNSKAGNSKGRHHGGARLVVAALPARQRIEHLVPQPCRRHQGPHPPHHRGGAGAQVDSGVVALSRDRHPQGAVLKG